MGYRGYGLPLGELISEGNVGMMQAVKRFDPDRGFRLATYAMWWIRAAIQEYILHSWSLVKMGTTAAQKKLFFNLRRLKGQMQAIEDGDLKPEQVAKIAHALDVPEQDVVNMNRRLSAPDHSLNAPLRADSEGEWQDWLVDESETQENALAEQEELTGRRALLSGALEDAERARAAHPDRAPAEGQPDHARGTEPAIQHLPRAGAPDRGARVREAAEGDEGAGGGTPPRRGADGGVSQVGAPPRSPLGPAAPDPFSQNVATTERKLSGSSACTQCPAFFSTIMRAAGNSDRISGRASAGRYGECAPAMNSVGPP